MIGALLNIVWLFHIKDSTNDFKTNVSFEVRELNKYTFIKKIKLLNKSSSNPNASYMKYVCNTFDICAPLVTIL
jgi:hypothetical protein